MTRREAVQAVALIMGGTIISADLFIGYHSGLQDPGELLTKENVDFLNEVAETILPATETPGAKEANVGAFMGMIVKDCYEPQDQKSFISGMDALEKLSTRRFGKGFMGIAPEQKHALLVTLDNEQKEYSAKKKPQDKNHYFRLMKELTLLGYFTSELGSTKALRYVAVPGKFIGSIPYKKGDKAWAID
jgi:hypothetical protein